MEGLGPSAQKTDLTSSDVGMLLCATRMRMGKDLQRIAEILHIRYNYLVAMEDGRYEDLPGQAYAVGFVRAYADHLGLDGDEIVRRYKEESSGLKNRPVFEFPVPTPDSGVPSGALILIAVVLGMIVYGVWYGIAGSDRSDVQVIQEVPDRLVAQAPSGTAPSTPLPSTSSVDAGEIASIDKSEDTHVNGEPVAGTTEPAAGPGAAPQSASLPAPAVSAVPASTDVVELRAKSDVWITLRTAESPDRTQFLHKGEVFRAPEGSGMTLVTGKPSDLEILVNGDVMPPFDEGIFARGMPLDPQRLKGTPSSAAGSSSARPSPPASPPASPGPRPASNPGGFPPP